MNRSARMVSTISLPSPRGYQMLRSVEIDVLVPITRIFPPNTSVWAG